MYTDEYVDDFQTTGQPNRLLPTKHDVLSSLAVGGRWITMQNDLQASDIFVYNVIRLSKNFLILRQDTLTKTIRPAKQCT